MSRKVSLSSSFCEFKNKCLLVFNKVCIISGDNLVNVSSKDFIIGGLNDKEQRLEVVFEGICFHVESWEREPIFVCRVEKFGGSDPDELIKPHVESIELLKIEDWGRKLYSCWQEVLHSFILFVIFFYFQLFLVDKIKLRGCEFVLKSVSCYFKPIRWCNCYFVNLFFKCSWILNRF